MRATYHIDIPQDKFQEYFDSLEDFAESMLLLIEEGISMDALLVRECIVSIKEVRKTITNG